MFFNHITLLTSKLPELKDFYVNVMELVLINENSSEFTIKVGMTNLTFKKAEGSGNPFYHYAVNIPENKFVEAKSWAQKRLFLSLEEDNDEVFFESWNAHSIYFEDPAGNIAEFIARHNLDNAVEHEFTSNDLLNISEIGVVVEEVIPFVRRLNNFGIPNWKEDSKGLTPVGNENALFIVVKNERRWFFSDKLAKFFPLKVSIHGKGIFSFSKTDNEMVVETVINKI